MAQSFPDREAMHLLLCLLFFAELSSNPVALVAGQPVGLPRPVGQIEDGDDAKDNGRNTFEDEQPSPAAQSEPRYAQQITGERPTDHKGKRIGGAKARNGFGAIFVSEPVR